MVRFTLFGIKIHIRFMFVALVTMFLIIDKSGIAIMGLLACIIHELGHICMFLLVGLTPLELHFELTGIRLVKPIAVLSYPKEILVQLAGAATNFAVFFLLCHGLDHISPSSIFAVTHLILGVFNLLPLKSFDGGKVLELALLQFCTVKVTARICTVLDLICVFSLLIVSVYSFFAGGQGFTLLILSAYLMISAIVKL